jgi:Predicted choline kinase involved in LPS biosynthesis
VPFHKNKLTRDSLLSRYFPDYHPVASAESSGLSGSSWVIECGDQRRVLRQHHTAQAAEFYFLRQYHALRRLPVSLAPKPVFYTPGWMVVEFIAGEVKSVLPADHSLAALLYHLHEQPRFGWRVVLLPLLEHYWQHCNPARRSPLWLRCWHQLRKQGEPQPLRLVPLHMDVHAGNIVHSASGLRLIDWEYAGDGDVALELAAVWTEDDAARRRLSHAYAQRANIAPERLWQQVMRWRPWVLLLMAGWYECRWQQTGDAQFITLANEVWCQLKEKR